MDGHSKSLKPCPFCGGAAAFGQAPDNEFDPNSGGHFIQCTNQRCEASSALVFAAMDDPYRELAERWNRREDAFKAGREAGMREAAKIAEKEEEAFMADSGSKDLNDHYAACASGAGSAAVAILSAIGGGK